MNALTKALTISLLSALLFAACDTKSTVQQPSIDTPPIEISVIAPAVAKQLANRFGDRFTRVGKVQFAKTETAGFTDSPYCYHVEFFYTDSDQEKRYVMELGKVIKEASPNLVTYECEIPMALFGEDASADKRFRVTIDEMMNEAHSSHQKPQGDMMPVSESSKSPR